MLISFQTETSISSPILDRIEAKTSGQNKWTKRSQWTKQMIS